MATSGSARRARGVVVALGFMYDLIEYWMSTNGLGVVRCETGGYRAAELSAVAGGLHRDCDAHRVRRAEGVKPCPGRSDRRLWARGVPFSSSWRMLILGLSGGRLSRSTHVWGPTCVGVVFTVLGSAVLSKRWLGVSSHTTYAAGQPHSNPCPREPEHRPALPNNRALSHFKSKAHNKTSQH